MLYFKRKIASHWKLLLLIIGICAVSLYVRCIQWHPEAMLVASDDMLPVFTGLIEAAKKAADK